MSNQNLERFKPVGVPTESGAPVELPQEVVVDEEAIEALKRLGIVHVGKSSLSDLAKVGVHHAGVGVFKIQRGQAFVTQQRLNRAMEVLLGTIEQAAEVMTPAAGGKNKAKLRAELNDAARTLGYLAARMTESQHLMVEMEQARPGGARDEEIPQQQSFKAGQDIKPVTQIVAKEVHITGGAAVSK